MTKKDTSPPDSIVFSERDAYKRKAAWHKAQSRLSFTRKLRILDGMWHSIDKPMIVLEEQDDKEIALEPAQRRPPSAP